MNSDGAAMTDDAPSHILVAPDLAAALPALSPTSLDQNPAAVYLASLSEGSRPAMRTALNTISGILGVSMLRDALGLDVRCLDVPWASMRCQHPVAIRARLPDRYAPVTASKLLSALLRVLREARRLVQLSVDGYDRATDLDTIRAECLREVAWVPRLM